MDLAEIFSTSGEVQVDGAAGSNVPTGFYLAPSGRRKSRKGDDPLEKFLPMLPEHVGHPAGAELGAVHPG